MRSLKTLVVTLYTYLGATRKHIRFSFGVEVVSLFGLAFILAALFGFGLLVWAFSFSDLLQWSFRLVLEIFVMLVAIFLLVLGMIWLFYRDLV
jgi:ABC-type antimicrobial peptide transport system permease subunit